MGNQYVNFGKVLKVTDKSGTERKKLKLGQEGSKDPKYDFTVQVRVLEGSPRTKEELKAAKVLGVFTNPWIDVKTPHENAPKTIVNELQIFVKETQG